MNNHKQSGTESSTPDTSTQLYPACVPVVVVGASAGGLEPLQKFLSQCPSDAGCAFVVLQHLPPQGESALAAILSKATCLPVCNIEDGVGVERSQVYILPAGYTVHLKGGLFQLTRLSGKHGGLLIDDFMQSVATEVGEHAVGVVLSGTGTDGAEGLKAIRENGGMTIAQEPESAQFDGMPKAAIYTGVVDFVGEPEAMVNEILTYLQRSADASVMADIGDHAVDSIITLLGRFHPNDFWRYKRKTILRRIQRRISLTQCADTRAYLALLQESAAEVDLLYQDLLISVTSFFRDPNALKALDDEVLSNLIAVNSDDALRVWVAGCATGEEAYTLAILIHEHMRRTGKHRPLQIFASDIDERALAVARLGVYPDSIRSRISPELLNRYFTAEGDYFRIRKDLREEVVFAFQNLITSAPFSRLDLISCRNLLIYLKVSVQSQIMDLFHFALRNGGYLFLGSSESIGRKDKLFSTLNRPYRIYQHNASSRRSTPNLPFVAGAPAPVATQLEPGSAAPSRARLGDRVHRYLLKQYAPPAVLVSKEGEVLYFVGETTPYLQQPSGQPSHALFDIARSGIKSKLRALFRKAVESNAVTHSRVVKSATGDAGQPVLMVAMPLVFGDITSYLITFEPLTPLESSGDDDRSSTANENEIELVQQLEDELSATRAELLSSIEDLETSNQDLKVSNEEAVSMNEELQSTNEELETSKEELQSLNEEMTTVNGELKTKVDELDEAYNDLDNLLKSISAATLFTDMEGKIRLFTPNCRPLFYLVDTDIGRPLSDIKSRVPDADLFDDIICTRESLETVERELVADDGSRYLRRTTPYRTGSSQIDGIVITYTDVTHLRDAQWQLETSNQKLASRSQEQLKEQEAHLKTREDALRQQKAFFELSSVPVFIVTADLKFSLLNSAWTTEFGWGLEQLYPIPLENLIHPDDWIPLKTAMQRLQTNGERGVFEARFRAEDGAYHWLEWDLKRDSNDEYFGVGRDVSEQVQSTHAVTTAQMALEKQIHSRSKEARDNDAYAHVALMCIGEAILTTNTLGAITTMNPVAERLTGRKAIDSIGLGIEEVLVLLNEDTRVPIPNPVKRVIRKQVTVTVSDSALLVAKDGTEVQVEASVSPVFDNKNRLLGTVALFFDVSYSRKLTKDVQHRANHDDLTGLINRGEFENRLKATVASAHANNRNHCLLYLDLDRFKIVNDSCGHAAGDELLRQLARGLQNHVRQRDTLARLGGDEFGLILENCSPDEAGRIASDILTFSRTFRFVWEEKSFQVGLSIGIVNIDNDSPTPGKLLSNADSACYMAKEAGRDRAYNFDAKDDPEQSQSTRMYWAGRVTQALEDDSLELVAQPIICMHTNQTEGAHFELLSRLRGDEGELITPANFLPAAERYNLMPSFDQHVVSKAFAWLADNPDMVKDLSICSINLSAATLNDDRFPQVLQKLIDRYAIPTEKVCFEITETLVITNLSKTIALAEEFKRQGFLFSLDDFGSGFSSYHYLKRLPVDFLKIDGEFVRGIVTDPVDEAMVRSMNDIGHVMGKKTIAEYVESEAILEKLKEIGVDYVQGYFTGMPEKLPGK
ncbi:EAL domain-containing protein [Marinobacter sp. 1Y8]